MKVLVTGATGLLGNNTVRRLLVRGHEIRALVRPVMDPRPLSGLVDVERSVGDVCDADAVREAVRGVDAVVHAAALVPSRGRGRHEVMEVNVLGTGTVARAARDAGARMVHVSTVDLLGWGTATETGHDPEGEPASPTTPPAELDTPYLVSKRRAEEVVRKQRGLGLEASVVSLPLLVGPWDWGPSAAGRMLLVVAKGAGLAAPSGSTDFAHVEDVADALVAAVDAEAPAERYVLGGDARSWKEAFAVFADVAGAPGPLGTAPDWAVRVLGRAGDLVAGLRGVEGNVTSSAAAFALRDRHLEGARARDELGYGSRPLAEAARDAWRWFEEYGFS